MFVCVGMFLFVFVWGGIDVNIDNLLVECVDIYFVYCQEMDNFIILKIMVILKKSIGECGCFLVLISYISLLVQDVEGYGCGSVYFFQEGNILLVKMQGCYFFSFVLLVDNQFVWDQKLVLMICCILLL